MHKNRIDRTGQRYGRIIVLGLENQFCWNVQCDCGARYTRTGAQLTQSLKPGARPEGCYHCIPNRSRTNVAANKKADRNKQLIADWRSGMAVVEVAKKHGISGPRVVQILKRDAGYRQQSRVRTT